jgi:ribosome biogenesis GTPase A
MSNATINWFPGHMVAARRDAQREMGYIDVVVEVLDARCPAASSNPMLVQMRDARQRPALKVLNKSDLADPEITARWIAYMNAQPRTHAIAISSKNPADVRHIVPTAQLLAPHRNEFSKPLRLMTMGVPNVGKSTIINALLKRRSAGVGDEPAVTKTVRRYNLSDTSWLVDTPGLMWPKIEDPQAAYMLAACHTLGVNAYFDDEVALFLAEILRRRYPQGLNERYNMRAEELTDVQVVEAIGQCRGFKKRGGAPDFEKAAKTLHVDFRSGALGRISLEEPPAPQ